MALIPKPQFPNVPKLPGVPQLARSFQFPAGPPPVVLVPLAIGRLIQAINSKPTWGIFDNAGNQVVNPTNVVDFGYRQDSAVSNFPVQNGRFASYDKVATPFEASVRMTKAGTKAERTTFLDQIQRVQESLDRFTIMTPEKSYLNCNVLRFELTRRGAGGAFYLSEVDLFFTQIVSVQAQYTTTTVNTSNAQEPGAKPPNNLGNVQSQNYTQPLPAGIVGAA